MGSSLGGHYANHLAEKYGLPAVLVNPAVVERLDLALFVGEHANFHTDERFVFTAEHAAQLLAQVRRPTPGRYWLLLEEGDEVLDYRQAAGFLRRMPANRAAGRRSQLHAISRIRTATH